MLVEVTYALEKKQTLLELEVSEGTTLKQAVELSGIIDTYPQIDLTKDKTGIFGKIVFLVFARKTMSREGVLRSFRIKYLSGRYCTKNQVFLPLRMAFPCAARSLRTCFGSAISGR